MPDSGSEAGTVATTASVSTIEEAAAVQSPDGASPGTEVRGAIAVWRALDVDVSAVIGHRGTAAVLRRALAMTRRTHVWLPEPSDDASFDVCVQALSDVLDARGAEESAAGSQAVQAAFRDLLATLVGASLTTQLLSAAWAVGHAQGEPMP